MSFETFMQYLISDISVRVLVRLILTHISNIIFHSRSASPVMLVRKNLQHRRQFLYVFKLTNAAWTGKIFFFKISCCNCCTFPWALRKMGNGKINIWSDDNVEEWVRFALLCKAMKQRHWNCKNSFANRLIILKSSPPSDLLKRLTDSLS